MDPQEQRRLGANRALVVGGTGPVGRPDLDEVCARPLEHVRNPEAVADLDQLAARDEDLAPLRERGQCEQHSGGVVVHDQGRRGPGQPAQEAGDVILPRAACALAKVVLEVRVGAAHLDRPLERRRGERRSAEVRVEDHAGRVQHPPQVRARSSLNLAERPSAEVARIVAGMDLLAGAGESRARRLDRQRARRLAQQLVAGELVHRREIAEIHRKRSLRPPLNQV